MGFIQDWHEVEHVKFPDIPERLKEQQNQGNLSKDYKIPTPKTLNNAYNEWKKEQDRTLT